MIPALAPFFRMAYGYEQYTHKLVMIQERLPVQGYDNLARNKILKTTVSSNQAKFHQSFRITVRTTKGVGQIWEKRQTGMDCVTKTAAANCANLEKTINIHGHVEQDYDVINQSLLMRNQPFSDTGNSYVSHFEINRLSSC